MNSWLSKVTWSFEKVAEFAGRYENESREVLSFSISETVLRKNVAVHDDG